MPNPSTVFLKLGGSLITDKARPGTPRTEILSRICAEIAQTAEANPDLRLLIGHGSGSFGHVPARKYGTRSGVSTPEGWRGFATVWHQAAQLNQIVVDALRAAGLPVIAFPPSAACLARDGAIESWPVEPLQNALAHRLVPIVFGDVVFDRSRGGTIVSTEDVFAFLTPTLAPERILIAGIEKGVWADYPACTQLIEKITPGSYAREAGNIQGSAHPDVTGGMNAKVREMLALVQRHPAIEILIFGGDMPGAVASALSGARTGTRLTHD